jgi:uncharacterized double-CXXCG motif protein
MTRFYEIQRSPTANWSSTYRAERPWSLPGLEECPGCRASWSSILTYPTVDLSRLEQVHELEEPRPASLVEYVRLRELVRPYCPPGAMLSPGTEFGPLVGSTRGKWGAFTLEHLATLFVRADALQALSDLRGIVPSSPRFRRSPMPGVAELELLSRGRLALDCLPPDTPAPCTVCGLDGVVLPKHYWVELNSLPTDLDVFRLEQSPATIVVSERFADVVRRFEPNDITLRPLLTSRPPGIEPPKQLEGNAAIIIRR